MFVYRQGWNYSHDWTGPIARAAQDEVTSSSGGTPQVAVLPSARAASEASCAALRFSIRWTQWVLKSRMLLVEPPSTRGKPGTQGTHTEHQDPGHRHPHPRVLSSVTHTPGQDRSSPCPHHQDQPHPPHHQAHHRVVSVTPTWLLAVRLLQPSRTPILTDGVWQYYFPHMTHYYFRAISHNRNLPKSDLWLTKVLVARLLQSVSFNFPGPGAKRCQAMRS